MKHDGWWTTLFTAAVILLLMSARGFEALLFLGVLGIVGAVRLYRGNVDKRVALFSAWASVAALAAALGLRLLTRG